MLHAESRVSRRGPAPGTPAYSAAWTAGKLDALPAQWRPKAAALHRSKVSASEYAGNVWLRELADSMREGNGLPMDATDEELRAAGKDLAASAFECAAECGLRTESGIRQAVGAWAERRGIAPPAEDVEDGPALARMFSGDWWVRKLRAAHGRRIERHAIDLGYVHKRAGCYVSDVNLWRRQEQRQRNARALAATVVENQFGDEFTLAELAERSTANPRIRRGELMTRIAGAEAVARGVGHVGEFVTVTAPSKYHAVLSASCDRNPKHEPGLTPRHAQKHLVGAWAKCRAAMARKGLAPYGFRIAEPHHDGCPHWHMLLFMPAAAVEPFRAAVRRYFLEEHDAEEAGARANRCKFVAIDWQRGSAAGYVAKYVSKNIDGMGIETDLYGNPAETTAARVDAWAATWGVRQFQQIGGPPVGAWRELRRLDAAAGVPADVEACRAAADAGDWGAYVVAQGGPGVKREDLTVRCAVAPEGEKFDPVEGCTVMAENRYGEACRGLVFGVQFQRNRPGRAPERESVVTRRFKWEARRGGVASAKRAPWSPVNNCTGVGDGVESKRCAAGGIDRRGGAAGDGIADCAATSAPSSRGAGGSRVTGARHGGGNRGDEGGGRAAQASAGGGQWRMKQSGT